MANALIVIDVQNGFVNEHSRHVVARIAGLIQEKRFDHAVFTQFINTDNSPYQRIMNWHRMRKSPETDIVEDLIPYAKSSFTKTTYSIFTREMSEFLGERKVDELYFCGIDTDICVLKSAVDAFEKGYNPHILAYYCASHYGPEYHEMGLKLARRFIGKDNVAEKLVL